MNLITTTIALILTLNHLEAVRLRKIFQFIDGNRSDHDFEGFLHVGNNYAVFLKAPKPHARELVYELYETKNVQDISNNKPRRLAISKIPLEYIKDQLLLYRLELYKSKLSNENIVPGTQVKTLREWQLDKALENNDQISFDQPIQILRSRM